MLDSATPLSNSIELMLPTTSAVGLFGLPNDEAVASEDVEGDENSSHHFFGGNKELLEHT